MLTLKAYRRGTPERTRRIPTIPAGRSDVGPANVSTVDTGPRRSESPWFVRQSPAPPAQVLLHRSLPAICAGSRWSRFDSGPAQNWLEITRVGLLHEGRDLLAKGCAYCTKAPPTTSTPTPPPVAPHPRTVHPGDAGNHQSDRGSPPTGRNSSSPIWQTHPSGVSRCHDIRNSQKS